jgi:menaquinone-dependent protoporphyrinogen oxidase
MEVTMTKPVLVAYATKRGSTHEVADAIAGRLHELGLAVELRPAAEVRTLSPYAAVVLGGALYTGRWHRAAGRFLAVHREALANRPFAVFALGPKTLQRAAVEQSRRQLDAALARAPEVNALSVAIFGGVVDPAKLRFPFNRMPTSDARDWNAIRDWTTGIAAGFGARIAATA